MSGRAAEILVPGGRFVVEASGDVLVSARIPGERPVVRVHVESGPRTPWTLEARGEGGGGATLRRDGVTAEVRDDAVLIVRADRATSLRVETLFRPEYAESSCGRHLLLDECGGVGVFPTRASPSPRHAVTGEPPKFSCDVRLGDELWICVCPSRLPSPLRASQHIAHEGRPRPFPTAAYPSTEIIDDAARHCDVLALHAYFWASGPPRFDLRAGRYALRRRPWTTARHVPADPDEFARVRDDVRRAGMKLVVYLSPRHTTAPDLLGEMQRVVEEYGVDGLYLDGISHDLRRSDEVLRGARRILGPDRILYLNASDEPFGSPRVRCPLLESHADFVLLGDAGRGGLPLDRFLRYAVSGRNVSNAVGMWCHYGSSGRVLPVERAPSARHVDAALRHGVRLWRRSVWGRGLAAFDARYYGAFGG